jgi:hypothetical protein
MVSERMDLERERCRGSESIGVDSEMTGFY